MSCKGVSFFFFGLLILGSALTYLLLEFRVNEKPATNCLIISYTWQSTEYSNQACFDKGQSWDKLKSSFRFYRAYSGCYIAFFAFYFMINMFFIYLGHNKIKHCNYYWLVFDNPGDNVNCCCGFIQGFFIAIFLGIVVVVSFVLLILNFCCPQNRPEMENKNYNYGTAENMYRY